MRYYVYRLANGGKRMAGLIDGDNPSLLIYKAKHQDGDTLYCDVGECRAGLVLADEVTNSRSWTTAATVPILLMRRLLTVRNEWSRK